MDEAINRLFEHMQKLVQHAGDGRWGRVLAYAVLIRKVAKHVQRLAQEEMEAEIKDPPSQM